MLSYWGSVWVVIATSFLELQKIQS